MICSVEDCTGKHLAHGYCQKHYTRWQRHGDPLLTLYKQRGSECDIDGCGREALQLWPLQKAL